VVCWCSGGSGWVGVVGIVIGHADILSIHQSISAIFLLTCWRSTSRSKGLHVSVALGREVVGGVIDSGRGSGGVIVAADQCCAW